MHNSCQHLRHLLRTTATVCSKDSDVYADDGNDNAEQNKYGHLADKSDTN